MDGNVEDASLAGLGRCLRFTDAPKVARDLAAALPGWPVTLQPAAGPAPAIRLRGQGAGYCQHSPELPEGLDLPTSASAACSLIADLAGEFFVRHPELIGLHCGSVEIDGRLAIFPEAHRAGKSTLTVAFAAAGYRVFGDDVLGLTPGGEGVALGIAPRLRLPLPDVASELAAYAERRAGPEDARYRFVVPPTGRLAGHGESRPLGALVLLERDAAAQEPEVLRLAPGEGLAQLLCQNFAYDTPGEALLVRLLPLMERLPCLLLRYREPLAAACRLARELEGAADAMAGTASPVAGRMAPREGECLAPGARWRPAAGVRRYPLHDELFLIHAPSGEIHRLNATGRAVWTLLEAEALSGEELGELLAEHFRQPREAVTEDVCLLLAGLSDAGLITSAG